MPYMTPLPDSFLDLSAETPILTLPPTFVLNDLGRACHGQGEDDDDDAMLSRESSRIEHVKASDSNVGRQALVTGRTNVLCAALSRVSCWS